MSNATTEERPDPRANPKTSSASTSAYLPATVLELVDQARFEEALEALTTVAAEDVNEHVHALLGLTCFQLQQYQQAAAHYAAALERDPGHEDWLDMYEKSRVNALSAIHEFVPPATYFKRDALLTPASQEDPALPDSVTLQEPFLVRRALIRCGDLLGWILTWVTKGTTELWGRVMGYRDAVWTNWYRRPLFFAVLTLAYMRDTLNRKNLNSSYPKDALTGFQAWGQRPPGSVERYRTANGSWNNLDDPMEGAAGTRFGRNVAVAAVQPETGDQLMSPNPRMVSLKLLSREGKMETVPFLNLLAASWIQFQVHDWVSHGENLAFPSVHEIPLPGNDPARRRYRQSKIFVGKTQPDPTRSVHGEPLPVTYVNEVTHWWDGSQIYGSDRRTLERLRSNVEGKLMLNGNGLLPVGERGTEATGFVRNWWVGLSMLHTLFVNEHNAICERLRLKYPHWDDHRLFNVARLINAAVMAKIHTVEWTPAILPHAAANLALHANWYGLATNALRRGKHRKTLSEFNVRHPEIGGVVGNPRDDYGVPFSLTEEFVEVYRLHSLLPESVAVRRHDSGALLKEIPIAATRQSGARKLAERIPMVDLFYSFGNQNPGKLVLNNYPRFMQEMSIPGNPLFDLGAVDILRARERGIPRYNAFRRQLGLKPIVQFEDLTDNAEQLERLKAVYGSGPEDIEKIDLLIGTLAEAHRPPGFGFGETLFQIFILNATRRLQADRFYTDCYNETTYTSEGLDWIDDADLKTVLLRHFPQLADTGLANVKNAFEPWDADEILDLERHPLRRFDPDLQADPQRGDAYR